MITEEERKIFYKVLREYNKEDAYSVACDLYGEEYVDKNITDEMLNTIAEKFENDHDMTLPDYDQFVGWWNETLG